MTTVRKNGRQSCEPTKDGVASTRRDLIFNMYVCGLSCAEIGRRLGVSTQRAWQLIQKYGFLPQSRYMREGALARAWMLRHRPKVFRRIVGEAAGHNQDDTITVKEKQ